MKIYSKEIEILWSDLDVNMHLTHYKYAVLATNTRMEWLNKIDCSLQKIIEHGYSAVILKDQTEYQREVFLGEKITVDVYLTAHSADFAKWEFTHELLKETGKLAAKYTVLGAWIDHKIRKIAPPPQFLLDIMGKIIPSADYRILD